MRYELSDYEWTAIKPMLPNKPRGVRRVNDRRVLNGIFWVLRSGAPWRDLPEVYGRRTTCYNRFVRWRRAGVWDQIMDALAAGHDAAVQMIDTSVVRVHQHGACVADNNHQDMGRSRGGLTSKIHAVVDTDGLPVHLALTPGEAHDNRLCSVLLSALLPQTTLLADRGYDADWIREFARQQGAEGPASLQLRLALLDDAPNSAFFRSLMPSESHGQSQEKECCMQSVVLRCLKSPTEAWSLPM